MNKIICGKCARKLNKPLEERKQMVQQLKEGLNVCACGRSITVKNGRLYY
jgi:intracellular sulfur oxidation DsrE/DsrF family protein